MAKAEQIKALVQSHGEGDDTRFYSVAMQVAANAARSGQSKFALELRDLVDGARKRAGSVTPSAPSRPAPIVQPKGELSGILSVSYPRTRLSDMVLETSILEHIEGIVHEHQNRVRLRNHNLVPARRILMVGPPGTGKTMTASALAGELNLPLFSIQIDVLITKYLGETASKLRLVFDSVQATRGVYLFDEFDALGRDRSASDEVGEIRRVLNSFLQFLEQDTTDSIVVGATNNPRLLDRALFRRFDVVLKYALPNSELAQQVMKLRLSLLDISRIDWMSIEAVAGGLSHGDLVVACDQATKKAILI